MFQGVAAASSAYTPIGAICRASLGQMVADGSGVTRIAAAAGAVLGGIRVAIVVAGQTVLIPAAASTYRPFTPVRVVRPVSPIRIVIAKGKAMQWSPKRAVDKVIRGVNWQRFLGNDEIVSASAAATNGVEVDQEILAGKVQTFRLSGGKPGVAVVTCSIRMRNG